MPSSEWNEKLDQFRLSYFPELQVESEKTKLIDGVAGSYYGVSNVGSAIHRCKYEKGGDFPDFLITLLLKAYYSKFPKEKFDLVLYVPPTVSGDLVRHLAERVSML
jgi:ATP-dependent DNA helicase RecQ